MYVRKVLVKKRFYHVYKSSPPFALKKKKREEEEIPVICVFTTENVQRKASVVI